MFSGAPGIANIVCGIGELERTEVCQEPTSLNVRAYRSPIHAGRDGFPRMRRFILQRSCHRFVPAIVETGNGNDRDDLDDLLLGPVLLEVDKHVISNRVRHSAGRHCQVECRTLGSREL